MIAECVYVELGQLKPVGVCLPVSIFISANRLCCVAAGM